MIKQSDASVSMEVDEPPGPSTSTYLKSSFQTFTYDPAGPSSSSHHYQNGLSNHEDFNLPSTSYLINGEVSNNDTLADILSDFPLEVLNGCGPDEAFRPDYKAALHQIPRPPNAPVAEPSPSVFHEEEILDPEDNFYFESDHLALKGNNDYRSLLKVIVTLQAQRTQAVKDLDALLAAKKTALQDPIAYVSKLQSGDLPEYPGPQKIPELPKINWMKYRYSQTDGNMRPLTRHTRTAPTKESKRPNANNEKPTVRGRPVDDSKSHTYNKLWTDEEQRRLEDLLIQFPPEEVEMKRWTKIANALGNRTPKQVASRIQKYFLKLSKFGLPIPGREPKNKYEKLKGSRNKHHHPAQRKSTFFPQNHILDELKGDPVEEVYIKEEYDEDSMSMHSYTDTNSESNQPVQSKKVNHLFHCYICNEQIVDVRWHCEHCENEVNLCQDCAYEQHQKEDPEHPVTHKLTQIALPKLSNGYDIDYMPQNFNTSNYLDPNFCPG